MAIFDPNLYQQLGRGIVNTGGDAGANPMLQTSTVQAPDGTTLRKNMDANGTPYFNTPYQNGVSVQYFPDPQTGEWKQREIKQESGGLVSGVVKTVTSDPQFMGFLAAAAGGMAAAYGTGSTAMAGLGEEGAAMTFGNGAGAGVGGAGAMPGATDYGAPQNMIGGEAGSGGLGPTAARTGGSSLFSNLMGGGGTMGTNDWLRLGMGAINGIGQTAIGNRQQNQMNDAVNQANQASMFAAQQAGQGIMGEARASGNDVKNWALQSGAHLSGVSAQSGQHLSNTAGTWGNNIMGTADQWGNRAIGTANEWGDRSIGAAGAAGAHLSGVADQWGNNLQGVAGNAGNNLQATADQWGNTLRGTSAASGSRMLQAAQQAADMSRFTPYNVRGGLAGAEFNGTDVTKTLDPRLQGIQNTQLNNAQGFLGSVNAGTPGQQRDAAFDAYNSWAKTQQNNQFTALQNRLASQGLAGLSVNSTGVNGQPIGVNPAYVDFAEGVARADRKAYMDSSLFGQQTTANQIAMGNSNLQGAQSIDMMGNEAIKMGQSLGDSQAAAGARAGGFLTQGAQQAGAWDMAADTQAGSWANNAAQQQGAWNTAAVNQAGMYANNAATQAGNWNTAAANQAANMNVNAALQQGNWNNSAALQQGSWNNQAASQAASLNTAAANSAGQWYNSAAQNAAMNTAGRQMSESQADAQRNRNLWDGIWSAAGGMFANNATRNQVF